MDDHGRATVEFADLPKAAVGSTMNRVFGADWFDEGPEGFGSAQPGTYNYDDESTYTEYEVQISPDGTATVYVSYSKVEEAVLILDELRSAIAAHRRTR